MIPFGFRQFFRRCPRCGRHFEVRLVDKKLARREKNTVNAVPPLNSFGGTAYSGLYAVAQPGGHAVLSDASPITVDTMRFAYTYECGHCDYEWTEKR